MAKWTNKFNLPAPLASAISRDNYQKTGDISVTGVIKPPRMRVLEERHAGEITWDVADGIWILLGRAVHAVLEFAGADHSDHAIEQELVVEVGGWRISGRPDVLSLQDGVLSDYKITSVWAFLHGNKPEWVRQLNVYRWLIWNVKQVEVKKLQIVAVLRDWSITRTYEPDYPEKAVAVVDVPLLEDTAEWVRTRLRLHQDAEKLKDHELPLCTPEERWEKPTTWAVQKPDAAKAYRVKATEAEAKELAAATKGMIVVERPGESTRCQLYCGALPFCSQGKALVHPEDRKEAVAG